MEGNQNLNRKSSSQACYSKNPEHKLSIYKEIHKLTYITNARRNYQ